MPEDTQYLGSAPVESKGYLEPDRYRVRCRCRRCGHTYSRVYKAVPKVDPPCPKKACKAAIAAESAEKQAANVEAMIETGQTPGHIGNNVRVQAVDQAAEIVMQDYGMTDLKDNTRAGDIMAPSLTPRQRAMSENFWGGGRVKDKRKPTYLKGISSRPDVDSSGGIGQAALNGAFIPNVAGSAPRDSVTGDNVLRTIHGAKYRPQTNIIYDTNRPPKKK